MSQQTALIVSAIEKPLEKITRPIPIPNSNQLLVKVTASGLNPHDQKVKDNGLFMGSDPTAIISNDIAGVVWKVGSEVTAFEIGGHVFSQSKIGLDSGGLQHFVLLEAGCTALVPKGISDDEAATLPICGISAFTALFHPSGLGFPPPFSDNEGVSPSNCGNLSLVIIGGGANTGRMAVQFVSLAGVSKIIVVAASPNAELLRSYGATHIIDRHGSNEAIKAQIHELMGDEVIFVLDAINTDHTLRA